jgi:hypothetical protein
LTVLGAGWLSVAATLAYVALATPIVGGLVLSGRIASSGSTVFVLAVATIATIPLSLATAGIARLLDAFRIALEPRSSVLRRVAGGLGYDASFAPLAIPNGYVVPQVAVGRFGAVVFRQAPGGGSVGCFGDRWEVDVEGEWMPLEIPSRRTRLGPAADGTRLGSDDRDFVVNVYAAVVTAPHQVDRAPWASVLRPDEILPYLAGLPSGSPRS